MQTFLSGCYTWFGLLLCNALSHCLNDFKLVIIVSYSNRGLLINTDYELNNSRYIFGLFHFKIMMAKVHGNLYLKIRFFQGTTLFFLTVPNWVFDMMDPHISLSNIVTAKSWFHSTLPSDCAIPLSSKQLREVSILMEHIRKTIRFHAVYYLLVAILNPLATLVHSVQKGRQYALVPILYHTLLSGFSAVLILPRITPHTSAINFSLI